jgi:NADPH:quinone reductase-like Zn-dependent oxidoreductase
MKAVVLHKYGHPSELKYEDAPDPAPGEGEVLVRVAAASINPIDWKMRSGEARERFPVEFPCILGRDVSGTVRAVGAGVTEFAPGDRVFALAWHTYAELCVVKASDLAKVPDGIDLVRAAALPLVALTGEQLISVGIDPKAGDTILISGAIGAVGRCAVWTARQAGANVIAGVRHRQLEEAKAIGADHVIALDDEKEMAKLGVVDAVANTVAGATADALLAKVKPGGIFASVVGPPQNAALHPTVKVNPVMAKPNPATVLRLAEAVQKGTLTIPIDRMLPLEDAAKGQEAAEKGGIGKVLLLA